MANHNDEDDKSTVVLDINALKEAAKRQQESLDDISSELEFSAATDSEIKQPAQAHQVEPDPLSAELDLDGPVQEVEVKPEVLLFDFNSEYFQKSYSHFPQKYDYSILNSLEQLNKKLSEQGQKLIVFNYNAAPKAVNQLCAQIKIKFPHIRTLILAKNLSNEKAQAHKASKSGANGYLSAPFKPQDLSDEIGKIFNS